MTLSSVAMPPAGQGIRAVGRRSAAWLWKLAGYRSLQLTPEGVRFIVLTIGVGVAAINTGTNLLYLLFAMMLSLIIISGILSEQCLKQVHVSRRLPGYLYAGQPAVAAFDITNRSSRFPLFSLRVMDRLGGLSVDRGVHLLHLGPARTVGLRYTMLHARRGRLLLQGMTVHTRFPFALFDKARTISDDTEVMVYPSLTPLPHALLEDLHVLGQEETVPRRGQGTTLYNLRLYQPGDDSRTIHWRTTAKKAQLIVRETEADDQRRATIALATRLPAAVRTSAAGLEQFERAVSLAASVATHFIEQSYEVRLLAGDDDVGYGMGQVHLHRLLSCLALCEPMSESEDDEVIRPPFPTPASELAMLVVAWPNPDILPLRVGTPGGRADARSG